MSGASYAYDGSGNRVKQTVGASVRRDRQRLKSPASADASAEETRLPCPFIGHIPVLVGQFIARRAALGGVGTVRSPVAEADWLGEESALKALIGRRLWHGTGNRTLAEFVYEVDKRGNRTQARETVANSATTTDTTIAFNDKSLVLTGTWADVSGFKETTQFSARLAFAFFGDEATLTMGTGPDHSVYDIYIDGSLWQSIDGYAAAAGTRSIVMTTGIDGRKLATEGLHTVELRNRAERHSLATGYKLRFQQLVVADKTYTAQTIRYSYDKLARVREARYAAGVNGLAADADLLRRYQYAFDVAGNRTQQSVALNSAAPTVTNYTYNAGNQLTSDGTNSYTYDSNGNLTSYTWDRANRMIGGGGATFSYDGAGNRLSQTVSSVVTQYLNDVQPGLAVVLRATQGANTERYAYSPRGIHEQEMGGQWYWSLQDGLGSVRGMSNNATAIVNVGNYDPYGVPFGGISGVSQMHGFTGEATNALGDVYLRARHYSPARGVFVSEDFLEMPNRYSYALGDVINQVDPNGLQPIKTYDRGGGGGAGTIIISRPTVTIDLAGGRNFGAPPTGQSWITVNAGSLGPSRGALHVSDGSQVALNPLTIPPGQTIINAFSPANFGGGVGFNEYLPEPVSNPSPNMPPDPAAAFCPAPQSENIREQEEQLSGNDIALGITQQGGFPLLREFTERLNSEPYRSRFGIVNDVVWWSDWADTFVTTVDFYDGMSPSEFRQGFSQVVSQAARIHVNLERVEERFELDDLYDFTDEEILAVYQRTYAFAYELYQIKSNVDICERTTFYLNGSTNPTIADEFKDEFCF